MDGTIQKYTLDMADGTALKPLIVKQGDTNSRFARISLVAFKEPWTIPFGCQIHINVHKNDGTYANATCTQEDEHTVLAPITEQMTAVPGTQLGELFFLGVDGDIRSQTFPLVVWDAVSDLDRMVSSDDFQALKEALRDVKVSTEVADIAAQYATEQGNQARDGAQRANDAADSIQVAVDAAAAAKACESNAKDSETAAAQTQQAVTDYVEAQKAAFVGYSKRESDSKYANALTKTVTGEGGITVEDAWTAPVLGLDVAGKSEQAVTTGAQLLDFEQCLKEWNSKYTQSNGRVYTVNALGVGFQNPISFSDEDIKVTLSGKVRDISGSRYRIELMDSSGNLVGRIDKDTNSITVMASKIRLNFTEGGAGEYADIMLNAGDTPLPYEPYTGGAPSPSPDYPQDIVSTGTVSTGAQLFYKSLVTLQGTGAEADITDKRAIKITYTRANGGKYAGFIVDDKSNIVGKTLTISYGSIIPSKSGLTPGIRLYWIDNNGSVLSYVVYANTSPTTITIEDPQNDAATKLALLLYADVGDTAVVNDYVIYKDIMINAGDTALPWEPYTGGKPSPSVEYPQTLEVTATGANLLKYPYGSATMTINGVTFTDNGDGTITANGTATQNAYYYLDNNSGNAHNVLGKNVWLSGCPAGGSLQTYVLQWFNYDGSLSAARDFGKGINFTVSKASANNYNIVIVIMAGVTANNLVFRPMLNNGDTTLPWEPYQNKSASITLTESLRGIGEYRDRIMCRDGVWGIERNVQLQKLNANNVIANSGGIHNENAIIDGRYTTILCADYANQIRKSLYGGSNLTQGFCNIAPAGKTTEWNITSGGKDNIYTINLSSSIYISVPISVIGVTADATAEEVNTAVKQYVVDNDVYVMFIATPTWEPFPDATQQALNALTTYTGTTHLTITAGGPAPTVTLDYVQDTHKALEQCQEAAKEYTDNQLANIVAALPTATQAAIVDNQTTRLLQEV